MKLILLILRIIILLLVAEIVPAIVVFIYAGSYGGLYGAAMPMLLITYGLPWMLIIFFVMHWLKYKKYTAWVTLGVILTFASAIFFDEVMFDSPHFFAVFFFIFFTNFIFFVPVCLIYCQLWRTAFLRPKPPSQNGNEVKV